MTEKTHGEKVSDISDVPVIAAVVEIDDCYLLYRLREDCLPESRHESAHSQSINSSVLEA
jgi:hypothetical protein